MPLTGSSSYIGTYDGSNYAYTALAHEMSLSRDFTDAFFDDEPLLRRIRDGKDNFRRGSTISGTSILIPILGDDVVTNPANGVLDQNELTQPTAEVQRGLTQASYAIAHYRMPMWRRSSENKIAKGANASRGDIEDGATKQMIGSFRNAVNGDLMSANAGARDAVQGIRHVLSESNTVGGIAQATDTFWAAKVTTGLGLFTMSMVDDLFDEATRGSERPDLLLVAYSSSNNIYGKIRQYVHPAMQLVNVGNTAKTGALTMNHLGMDVEKDDAGTSGELILLNTKTWFYHGDIRPHLVSETPWPGTDATVRVYNMYCAVGNSNPRLNGRGTGAV